MGYGDQSDLLFTALAEQLKQPLLQIARLAELSEDSMLPRISVISEQALRLVDAYVQSHAQDQTKLILEPITSSAVLYDVAHLLEPYAKQHHYELVIDQMGKAAPVMTHRESLKTMLSLLGASLIESSSDDMERPRRLVLGTHRSSRGTVVGVFSNHVTLSQRALQLTRELHGRASQTIPSLATNGGASLAIADRLCEQMEASLKAYRHRSLNGIGSLLMPSQQLQLI